MKKIYGLILSLTAMTFIGCSGDNDPNADKFGNEPESGWIQFEPISTYVLAGAVTEFEVPVKLMAPVNTSGLSVNYTVTDVQGSSEGFVYSGVVEIPRNELTGYIHFTIPETTFTNCTKFEITLTSTSRSNVQVGLVDDVKPVTHMVNVISRDAFIGTYIEINQNFTATAAAGEEANELIFSDIVVAGGQTRIFLEEVAYVYAGDPNNPLSEELGNDVAPISYPNYADNFLINIPEAGGDLFVSDDYLGIGGLEEGQEKYSYFQPCDKMFDLNFFVVDATPAVVVENVNVVLQKL